MINIFNLNNFKTSKSSPKENFSETFTMSKTFFEFFKALFNHSCFPALLSSFIMHGLAKYKNITYYDVHNLTIFIQLN